MSVFQGLISLTIYHEDVLGIKKTHNCEFVVDHTAPTEGRVTLTNLNQQFTRSCSHSNKTLVLWDGLHDNDSPVLHYNVTILVNNVVAHTSIHSNTTSQMRIDIGKPSDKLVAMVTAYNGAGLQTTASSNALYRVSAVTASVAGFNETGINYTYVDDRVDSIIVIPHHCVIKELTWTLIEDTVTAVKSFTVPSSSLTEYSPTMSILSVNHLQLKPNRSYQVVIVVNVDGYVKTAKSQGFTVETFRPKAALVRDGLYPNVDVDIQLDRSSLAVTWSNFVVPDDSMITKYTIKAMMKNVLNQ